MYTTKWCGIAGVPTQPGPIPAGGGVLAESVVRGPVKRYCAGNVRLLLRENRASTSWPDWAVTAVGRLAVKGAVAGAVLVTGSTPGAPVADAAGARSSGGRNSTFPGYAGTMFAPS